MSRKLTTTEFIERSNIAHSNKYDYSLVQYVKNSTKVKIICPIHGEFEQTPASHLKGVGCYNCHGTVPLTTNTFIAKANAKHNNKYDYSKVEYKTNRTKVLIICPLHGEFEQQPNNHLSGQGCPICGQIKRAITQRSSSAHFIERSKSIHKSKYDYSCVDYQGDLQKVTIICPIHGKFEQSPGDHLVGKGCRECGKHSLGWGRERYKNKSTILYVLNLLDGNYKLGITHQDSIHKRYQGEPKYPVIFEQHFVNGSEAWNIENIILDMLKQYKYKGDNSYFRKTKIQKF